MSVDDVPRSDDTTKSGVEGGAGLTASVPLPVDAEKVAESDGARFAPVEYDPGTEGVNVRAATYPEAFMPYTPELPMSAPAVYMREPKNASA